MIVGGLANCILLHLKEKKTSLPPPLLLPHSINPLLLDFKINWMRRIKKIICPEKIKFSFNPRSGPKAEFGITSYYTGATKDKLQGVLGEYRVGGPNFVQLALKVPTSPFLFPPTPPHQMV